MCRPDPKHMTTNTERGESCLIAGFTEAGKPIHVVCGKRGDWFRLNLRRPMREENDEDLQLLWK